MRPGPLAPRGRVPPAALAGQPAVPRQVTGGREPFGVGEGGLDRGDGRVMQSNGKPEPELNDGFEQGGWQVPCFGQDMDRLTADWIAAVGAFLLGRRTCELFVEY